MAAKEYWQNDVWPTNPLSSTRESTRMAAVKASMTMRVSVNGVKLMSGVMSTPANAAIAEPAIHDAAVTLLTLMPHSRAASGSSATARIDEPSTVHRSTAAVPRASTTATA